MTWGFLDDSKKGEFLAEDQLAHLKTYRYQSVDRSLISNHILRHYVRRIRSILSPNTHLRI